MREGLAELWCRPAHEVGGPLLSVRWLLSPVLAACCLLLAACCLLLAACCLVLATHSMVERTISLLHGGRHLHDRQVTRPMVSCALTRWRTCARAGLDALQGCVHPSVVAGRGPAPLLGSPFGSPLGSLAVHVLPPPARCRLAGDCDLFEYPDSMNRSSEQKFPQETSIEIAKIRRRRACDTSTKPLS